MNKTAIKNFAVWVRRKLMDDVTLKARSLGITAEEIVTKNEEKSTKEVHFLILELVKMWDFQGLF